MDANRWVVAYDFAAILLSISPLDLAEAVRYSMKRRDHLEDCTVLYTQCWLAAQLSICKCLRLRCNRHRL